MRSSLHFKIIRNIKKLEIEKMKRNKRHTGLYTITIVLGFATFGKNVAFKAKTL
jgi:hypothetical protein